MIYALVFRLQEDLIEEYCFGKCKKIICGAMMDQQLGELGVCRTPKEECPYLEREMDEPFGEVNGESVIIRKLK